MEKTMAQVNYHLKLDEDLEESLKEYCEYYSLKRNRAFNEMIEESLRRDKERRLCRKCFG